MTLEVRRRRINSRHGNGYFSNNVQNIMDWLTVRFEHGRVSDLANDFFAAD